MHYPKKIAAAILCLLLLFIDTDITALAGSMGEIDTVFFTILHTNDEHSALLPLPLVDYDPAGEAGAGGGFARLATAVKSIRAEKSAAGEPVLLLSAGDYLTGSPFAWLALEGRAPELKLMHSLAYDAITIGNHEFEFGPEVLASYYKAAGYPAALAETPIIASNTAIPIDHPLAEVGIVRTHIKILENGLRVGFFGLLGEEATDFTPYAPPITFTDATESARTAVAELKAAKADVIVGLSHCGEEEDRLLAGAVSGIDIIIGGHAHTALEQPLQVGNTIIAQAGTQFSHLGILELAYDFKTEQVSLRNEVNQPYLLPLDKSVPFDKTYGAMVDH